MNRLGYRTNAHAKVLREGVAGMIGFIGDSVATTPFAGAIIEGAQQRAWEDGLLLLTVNTGGDKELEAASLDTMLSYKVAGVVYAAMYHRRLDVPEALTGVRSVVLNSQDRAGRLPSVAPDEVKGGYTATRRLLEAGHTRVAMINIETLESELPAAVGRYDGYCAALEEAGLDAESGPGPLRHRRRGRRLQVRDGAADRRQPAHRDFLRERPRRLGRLPGRLGPAPVNSRGRVHRGLR